MKLYDFALAPNPRRVRMFLAEKGVEIPSVQINTREREQFSDAYRAINPSCTVPALVLDDGTCITESVAICRYVEEIHAEPPLMGVDAKDRALVEMWNRRAELEAYQAAAEAVRNGLEMFADRALPGLESGEPQIPALVERGRRRMGRFFAVMDARLGESRFLAGDRFTIADITAFVTVEFCARIDITVPEACSAIGRWHAEIAARPSAGA